MSNVKMFSNDILPVFVVDNIDTSAAELKENILRIKLTFPWKMRFNLDPNIRPKKLLLVGSSNNFAQVIQVY